MSDLDPTRIPSSATPGGDADDTAGHNHFRVDDDGVDDTAGHNHFRADDDDDVEGHAKTRV
jgi:hypothetical protein